MKFINGYFDRLAIGALFIGSIISIFVAILIFCSVLFNFKPFIEVSGTTLFGLTDFKKGIPLEIKLNVNSELPDTIINYSATNNFGGSSSGEIYISRGEKRLGSFNFINHQESVVLDTFLFKQNIHEWNSKDPTQTSISSHAFKLTDAIVYIDVKNKYSKIIFILPQILTMLLLGFCCWHFAMVLYSIRLGESFIADNYRRLNRIGLAFIIFQLIWILLTFALSKFSAGVSLWNQKQNYTLYSFSGSPDYRLNFSYFFIGGAILILAQAFKRGYQIQQEQDLTV